MTDNGDGPKVLGSLTLRLVERAGGAHDLQFEVGGACQGNEIVARGMLDKARELLAQFFIQQALQQAMNAVKTAPAAALDALRKHSRG